MAFPPKPICTAPRSRASSASRSSSAFSARRERRMRSAVCLFDDCERSFWTLTTIPVGRCVIRTAEAVLVTCFAAAALGVERDGGVPGVVLAAEDRVLLELLQLAAERRDRGLDLGRHLPVHREELGGVLVLLREPAVALEPPRDARVLGRDPRGPLLVVPEAGLPHLLLELCEAGR